MAKYRKKPIVIDAVQWFTHGDNPDVLPFNSMFDNPCCSECHHDFVEHGRVKTLEGEHIVCPSDWIITGVKGEKYPCKPDIFKMTYEEVDSSP